MTTDTTIKKVQAEHSPQGGMGQTYLVAGKTLSMRLWDRMPEGEAAAPYSHDYETVGYVISGRARLEIEGQEIALRPGDSWMVPPGARHLYHIEETFTAIEASSPPAEFHGDRGRTQPGKGYVT